MTTTLLAYRAATALGAPLLARRAAKGLPEGRIGERQGRPGEARPAGQLIWLHAASVGEVRSVLPLVARLRGRARHVLVTTQTATGAAAVGGAALHQFAPLETPAAVARFVDHWRPDAALFVESELPPRMIEALAAARVPMALVNARMSGTRDRFPQTAQRLLGHMRFVTAQGPDVAAGLRELGIPVAWIGDLKSEAIPPEVAEETWRLWSHPLTWRPAWVAASTHPGEETIVAEAHRLVLAARPEALLCLAPRHPERADEVAQLIRGFTINRHSKGAPPQAEHQVHLVDTLGDLPLFHSLVPLTFLGGSFVDLGGHAPYEAAAFGCNLLHGPHVARYRAAYEALGAMEVTPGALANVVLRHMRDPHGEARPIPREGTAKVAELTLGLLPTVAGQEL
ncbi:MAG: 3-deoxy-D-manno-octulosonic acid transferase [Shimia sp.]